MKGLALNDVQKDKESVDAWVTHAGSRVLGVESHVKVLG